MRCAIMQPTYFPWAGYFNLIKSVDVFVFLDDVQYERGTWQNRNRVLVSGKPHWLTVPVVRGELGNTLDRVQTDEKLPWRRKHLELLRQTYGKHPFGADLLTLADSLLSDSSAAVLADLNIRIIRELCVRLGIAVRTVRTSVLAIPGKRTERLIHLCEHFGCDEYLSPPGSLEYLTEDRFCEQTAVRLLINDYAPQPYVQKGGAEFISHLSIIDVVANIGWHAAADYVGRKADTRLIEAVAT